jgi:hypothetical protein
MEASISGASNWLNAALNAFSTWMDFLFTTEYTFIILIDALSQDTSILILH